MEDFKAPISSYSEEGYHPLQNYEDDESSSNNDVEEFSLEELSAGDNSQHIGDDNTEVNIVTNRSDGVTSNIELTTDLIVNNESSDYSDFTLVSQIFVENCDENINLLSLREDVVLDSEDIGSVLYRDKIDLNNSKDIIEDDTLKSLVNGENEKKNGQKHFETSESTTHVGFEAVLVELGNPGKFFCIQYCLIMLTTYILTSTVLIYVFTGYEPEHSCQKVENETSFLSKYELLNSSTYELHYGKCDITVTSNTSGVVETVATFGCLEGHDYKGYKHISFVAEWDLVCDNVGLKELVQTMLMVGQTVGGVIFTSLADKFGRRPTFLLCNLLLLGSSLGAAYAPNIYVLIVFRFLCGPFQMGVGLISYTLMMELVTAKHRQLAGVLAGLKWSFTVMLLALIAYLMRDESWRTVQMVAALFACNVFLGPFIYESPRWLIANKRYDQALVIIKKACQTNGKDYEKVKAVFNRCIVSQQDDSDQDKSTVSVTDNKVERYSLLDIVRHKTLLISALIMFFVWITCSTTYYGLYLTSSNLAGNRHLNFFLLGVADLPADILNLFLFTYFGRKPVIMGWFFTAGSGLFVATMLRTFGSTMVTSILSTFFSMIGKLGIGASFNGVFMYTPELFPTNLRSAGLGVCSSVARVGSMASPYSQALADVILWGPGLVFSCMCFLSAIMFIKLPETRGQPMPSTIKDMKQRSTGHRKIKHTGEDKEEIHFLDPKESSSVV
uniref:Major facilitator superfamily (MFS) profile domain-containing protein n=1 Tax=Arion vulgaris TaxID=1028688 RepID=A0A0B6ZY51_9EUPU